VTSSPTSRPSILPSISPITLIPSSPPSFTGFVATVRAIIAATNEVETMNVYTEQVATIYGVNTSDVLASVSYSSSGSFVLTTIPEGRTEEEIINAISVSLVDTLGVHSSDVDVDVNMQTGDVSFTVSSESYDAAADILFQLNSLIVEKQILSSVGQNVETSAGSYTVSDEIEASMEFTIDADETTRDLTAAAFQTEQFFSSFSRVDIDSNYALLFDKFSIHFIELHT